MAERHFWRGIQRSNLAERGDHRFLYLPVFNDFSSVLTLSAHTLDHTQ